MSTENPFGGGRPTPTPPRAPPGRLTLNLTWAFICGHIIMPGNRPGTINTFQPIRSFNQQCPECLEATEDRHKAERTAARNKAEKAASNQRRGDAARTKLEKEAMLLGHQTRQKHEENEDQETIQAKAREKEREATSLSLYKVQATFITKQIEDAGDDMQTRADFTKMLNHCNMLLANTVRKSAAAETKAGAAECKNREELNKRLEKAELMLERAEILLAQHAASSISMSRPGAGQVAAGNELASIRNAWKAVIAKMKDAMDTYDEKIAPHLKLVEDFENETKEAWEEALELMKK